MKERDIFDAALAIADPGERDAFLSEACDGDSGLMEHVRGLLDMRRKLGSFLEAADSAPTMTIESPQLAEGPGTVIGPYKLLEQIGEGGMGVVYMAEQTKPVRRKVALKIIKPGMDTKQVIARFEAERQALALMDHPNIARVLDAGATESGRPYFVMELVKGLPITDYCDRNRLAIDDRLDLFVQVCQAVQHAHQKGIIHRDLKPTNVLVTMIDGAAVPKVIDFGVAKAIGQQLTEKTLYTGFAQLIGTPLYMSPEQAEFSGVDVDTRSDIYALGVLLYELLTGTTPFDQDTFRTAAFDEIRRIIREQEPPKPSTRISSLEATATTVSANRQSDSRALGKSMRGELDWIVMKALEKDRRRRYETASAFGADVMRYLADEPVAACPPSAWYRFSKLARRNRAALAVTAGFALILVAATAFSTWQAWRATRAEDLARQRLREVEGARAATAVALQQSEEAHAQAVAVSTFLVETLRSPDPSQDGRQVKVADVLDRASAKLDKEFAGSPTTKGELLTALGKTYLGLGLYDQAVSLQTKAVAEREAALGPEHPDTLANRHSLAVAYQVAGRTSEAIALHQATLKLREASLGPEHPDTLNSRNSLAIAYQHAGRRSEAIALFEATLKLREAKLGPDHSDTLASRNNLAVAYREAGRLSEAIALHQSTLKFEESKLGPEHPDTLRSRGNLAVAYREAGRLSEALAMHESTLKLQESKLGPEHPETLTSRHNLANAYLEAGRTSEAIALYELTLKLKESKLGPDHPDTLRSRGNLAIAYQAAGRTSEAIALYELTLKLQESKLGPDHPNTHATRNNLALAYKAAGRLSEAIALYQATLKLREAKLGPEHSDTLGSRNDLANAYFDAGRTSEAIALYEATLKLIESKPGLDHPLTHTTRNNLALAYGAAGRISEAIALFEATLKLLESKLGPEHPETLDTMRKLAFAWDTSGNAEKAKQLYEQALAVQFRDRPNHPDTLDTMSKLVPVYWTLRRYDRATEMGRRSVEGNLRVLGLAHPATLPSIQNYVAAAQRSDRTNCEAACKLLETVRDRSRRELGHDAKTTITLTGWLSETLCLLGEVEKATAVVDDLPENRQSLDVREELARGLYSHSDREAALVQFQRIESLRPRLVPADDPLGLGIRTRLALALREHGRFDEARPLLEETLAEALRLRKKLPKRDATIERSRGIAQFLLSRWPGLAPGISPAVRPPASFAIEAPFRTRSPVADGRLDPEEYGPAIEVTFDGDANPGRLWAGGKSRSKTPDDLSVRIHTAYTDRSLFLAFQVRDQFVDASELDAKAPYKNDAVDVCINGDQVANDLTPVFQRSSSGNREGFTLQADAAGHRLAAPDNLTDAEWKVGTSRTPDGYIVEFEIPLALIDTRDGPEFVPATSGSELRVNFGITDNDAPVHEQTDYGMFWAEDPEVSPWFGGEDFWTVSLRLVPKPASRP